MSDETVEQQEVAILAKADAAAEQAEQAIEQLRTEHPEAERSIQGLERQVSESFLLDRDVMDDIKRREADLARREAALKPQPEHPLARLKAKRGPFRKE